MFRLLGRYIKKYTLKIILNIILVSVQMFIQIYFLAHEMQSIIDNGVAAGDMGAVSFSGLKMIVYSVMTGIFALMASYLSSSITAGVTADVRSSCYKKVLGMTPQDYSRFGESTLLTRTVADATQMQILMINFMRSSLMVPIVILILLISVLLMNKTIFFVIFVVFLLSILFLTILGAKSKPYFNKLQRQLDRLNLLVKEKITGVRTIRSFCNQEFEEKKLEDENQKAFDLAIAANNRINFLSPIAMIVMNWTVVVIYYIGNSQLKTGLASISDMLVIFQYVTYFITTLAVIPMLLDLIPKVVVSSERINELLDYEPTDVYGGTKEPAVTKGEIEFKNVCFGYDKGSKTVYDLSFTAKAGTTTAFIGATGSGKTTIMNLIMGFIYPTSGTISIDGQSYDEIDIDKLKESISYATQGASVYQDTAFNNITMYDDSISKEKVESACYASCFDEVIKKMPEGIETVMAQGGKNISGGQRQRLSLARTIAKNAEVYIFDDTFSALDGVTEKKTRDRIKKMLKGKTIFMVAQKINTIRDADQILVLDHGTIVGRGSHDELLKNCKVYREIFDTQCYLEGKET